jgi:hypothetical protein
MNNLKIWAELRQSMSYREIQLLVWTRKRRNLLKIYIEQEVYILRKLLRHLTMIFGVELTQK